jgi:hypothetical protein
MLERYRAVVRVDYVARLVVNGGDPPRELLAVGDGGGEEDEADLVGKEDDALLERLGGGQGGREGGREGGRCQGQGNQRHGGCL